MPPSSKVDAIFPLSPTQEGMLYHTLRSPNDGVYLGQHTLELRRADSKLLREAWRLITQQHGALRSLFAWEALSRPVQVVYEEIEPEWHEISLEHSPETLTDWLALDAKRGFQIDAMPASRVTVVRTAGDHSLFVWTRHHLMMDGWSAHIVLGELHAAYTAMSRREQWHPRPEPGMAAYIAWLQQQGSAASAAYWRQTLSGVPVNPGLEAIRSPGCGGQSTRRINRLLEPYQTGLLRQCATTHHLTLSSLVHGAWAAVLGSFNETAPVIFGSTVSGRPAELADREWIVGNLINTVPVVADATSQLPMCEWLRQLQAQIATSARHGHVSYREIIAAAGADPGVSLFDTIVVFMNYPRNLAQHSALEVVRDEYDEHSHYPVAVLAVPGEKLELIVIHDPKIIPADQADRLLSTLTDALSTLPATINQPATSFFEQVRPNASDLRYTPLHIEPRVVTACFAEAVSRHGSRAAVRDGNRTLTYTELEQETKRFGRELAAMGVVPGDRVIIMMPRSSEAIAAVWAVLLLGCVYIPLPPETPKRRLGSICREVTARVIVSDRPRDIPNVLVPGLMERDRSDFEFDRAVPLGDAYTIFTSGSTGTPKGVTVSHQQLAFSLASRLQYYGANPVNFGLFSSLAFDSSVAGLFWTVATGGCLVIVDDHLIMSPRDLVPYLVRTGVDTLLTLPSVHRALLSAADARLAQQLETVIVAGEPCPASLLAEHTRHLPKVTLYNEYGPTEATVWCSARRFTSADHAGAEPYLSIGSAIPGVSLSVRDNAGQPVPRGATGELVVGGPTVAFVNTADGQYATGDLVSMDGAGELLFKGRKDLQFKVRGHRVDPHEIEAALSEHPDILECAVRVARPSGAPPEAAGILAAFVVRKADATEQSFHRHLVKRLPEYMLPRRYVVLDALPRNTNGKLAPEQLVLPKRSANHLALNPLERTIAGLWQQVLKLDDLDPEENFFELGGDSIASIQLVALASTYDVEFSAQDLFEHPSIRDLARHLAQGPGSATPPATPEPSQNQNADLDEMMRVLSLE